MTTTAPYRIATDTKPEWKIQARTHGPIRTKTLTRPYYSGTALPIDVDMMTVHRSVAQSLAQKINPEAAVQLHSGNGVSSMDWAVILP